MKNLAKVEVILPHRRRRPGRPKKILDLRKLDSIQVAKPESPEKAIESLLIFDARCLERETQQELLRILPQLVHIRRAWKAEYMECGCLGCRRGIDPTVSIAARLRRRGMTWAEVYEITAHKASTRRERKRFEGAVRWKLEHLDVPEREPSNCYGAGGLCNACYARIGQRMRNRYRKAMQGRNIPAEINAFRDVLCLRYNAAQQLFNGGDE
jgi:hypothetical protein